MTLLDCVGIGINGIIGTGIFLLPARVFRDAGALSWAAWLAIGAVCLLVGLCFCETSGRSERNGGPYLYARDAFGRWVGVGVGWMALASNFFAYGAVARAFGRNLSFLVPPLNRAGPQIALAIAVIGGLAALNYRGIRPGALTSDVFSGAKLIPILLFVGLGLLFVDWHRLALPAPAGKSTVEALKLGGFAALFACTGFEYVPVAAGETENPRRNIPLALIFALLGSMLLYVLVQIVFMGTHPDPGAADKPLAEAAAAFAGPWAGGFVAVGSVISSFGYLTAVALVTPRYLSALSENGELPPLFARTHPRFGTPSVAIGLSALVCAGLAVFADFDRLADLNNAAVFAQYVPTCLAVPMLRRTKGASAFHLPLGPTIPVLATLGCILFLNGIKRADAVFSVATLAVGLVLHAVWRVFGRRPVLGTG
ncbi:MAG: APC family permease [Deltaproteobacteria bacterium]|jgi:APA family basic amino acid/polyamine antiporter|nr:MAG: APC family permease [Deltaproteobacteria bacterium]TMB17714.1 MAG: APC family permease [Deltaproteobacteria bacterium]